MEVAPPLKPIPAVLVRGPMFPGATTVVRAPVKVVLPLLPIPVVLAGDPMPPDATTEIRPARLSGDPPIVKCRRKNTTDRT